jgi:hypothetical protein
MADSVVGLEIRADSAGAIKSVGSIKAELKAAQQESISLSREFGDFSAEATAAAKKVANLRDEIGDANARIKLFDPGAKFQAFTGVLNTAAGGFSALTGAAALFGSESEDLQKTLVKVQSALALTQGLNAIADAGDAFKNFGLIAKQALNGIKTGIAATGIGALVVALGLIVAYWEDIKELVSGVTAEAEQLNEVAQENLEIENQKTENLGSQDNILKLQGKSEKEILDLKIQQLDANIKAQEAAIEAGEVVRKQQIAATERNQRLLKGLIDFFTIPIRAITKFGIDSINTIVSALNLIPGVNIDFKLNGQGIDDANTFLSKLIFDPEKTKADGEAAAAEAEKVLLKLQNDRAGLILSQNGSGAIKAKEPEKLKEDKTKENLEKALSDARNLKESVLRQDEKIEDEFGKSLKEKKDQRLKDDLDRQKISNDAAIEAAKTREQLDAEEAARIKQTADARIATFQAIGSALGTLGDIVGKETVAGKALSIAQATIDTIAGATKAFAQGGVFGFVTGGAIIAAGLANVRKIIATKIPGQSAGGSVPSITAPQAPNIPRPQQQTTALDRNSLNQIGNATARAFVVESDVTNSQERIRQLNRAARLG